MITRRAFLGSGTVFLAASGLCLPAWAAKADAASGMPALLGVDYYPDQTPETLWDEDARMIAETGFTDVRIAEFAWSLMEPSEGQFDFAWLHRAVSTLQKHGIVVILGTPSAAPPPWLTAKYPDVLMVNDQGMTVSPGGRRFTCPTNKQYRKLSLDIATQMALSFADTPGVIGWQIDNEFTLQKWARCYCKYCRAGFQDWLKAKYGTLDEINSKWGTAFWSQVYTDWSQIPVPLPSNGDPNPGLALDYNRYQSYANASFQEEQLVMLRKMCPKHFVTTNNVGAPLDNLDLHELYKSLDFASPDNYPGFAQMFFPGPPEVLAMMISLGLDSMRCVKDKPFMVMEQQSGKAGQSFFSPPPRKGQIRLWTYQAFAHGAMGLNYFRWDTANFGAEEYWHGLLNHDRSKSPSFDEIQQTVKEIKALGPDMLRASYPASAAVFFDLDSDWATTVQPGNSKLTYMSQMIPWYSAVASAHVGIDVIQPESDLSRYRAVFAPLPYVVSATAAANIRKFVENGGLFVSGFRLGVKDVYSQIVRTSLPGLLRDVMGATVRDYGPIYTEKIGVEFSGILAGPPADCSMWADVLKPATATALATYTGGAYAGEPAITVNSLGKGKAVYIGAGLDPISLGRVVGTLLATNGVRAPFDVPFGVELCIRKSATAQWFFLLNHTGASQAVTLPFQCKDLLTGTTHSGKIGLDEYGVRVLQPA